MIQLRRQNNDFIDENREDLPREGVNTYDNNR